MQEYDLKPVWRSLLKIYGTFVQICERHHLRHYLAFGSTLGVLRHGGFIPWDDDFDVLMPREDYERLIDIAIAELPEGLCIRSWKLDANYLLGLNKIAVTDQTLVDNVRRESNLKLPQGLYIDIFPLDGLPKAFLTRRLYWGIRWCYWALGAWLFAKDQRKYRLKYLPLYGIGWVMSWFHRDVHSSFAAIAAFEEWCKKFPFSDSDYSVWYLTERSYFFPPRCFGEPVYKPFVLDDVKIMVPVATMTEKTLELEYGDWRKFPPPDQRLPWHQFYS